MNERTRQWWALRAAVQEKVNDADLNGLLADGAPADEYEPEIQDLLGLMGRSREVTAEAIATVWHKWFSEPGTPTPPPTEAMARLADELESIRQQASP